MKWMQEFSSLPFSSIKKDSARISFFIRKNYGKPNLILSPFLQARLCKNQVSPEGKNNVENTGALVEELANVNSNIARITIFRVSTSALGSENPAGTQTIASKKKRKSQGFLLFAGASVEE